MRSGAVGQELHEQAAGAPARGGGCRRRANASRRRRGGRGSGSARTGGNRCGRPPRGCRRRAARRPGSGCVWAPWSMVMASVPLAEQRRPDASPPAASAAATRLGVEAGIGADVAARCVKSTTSMSTGPSVSVCRMNLPSNFSDEPSSTVSTTASPSRRRDRRRIVVAGEDRVERRAELDGAAAHVERRRPRRAHGVVAGRPSRLGGLFER